jgi:hypothetical protein
MKATLALVVILSLASCWGSLQAQQVREEYEITNQDGLVLSVLTTDYNQNSNQSIKIRIKNTTNRHIYLGATSVVLDALYDAGTGTPVRQSREMRLPACVIAPNTEMFRSKQFGGAAQPGPFTGFEIKRLDMGEVVAADAATPPNTVAARQAQEVEVVNDGKVRITARMGIQTAGLRLRENKVYFDVKIVNISPATISPSAYKLLLWCNGIPIPGGINFDPPASMKKRAEFVLTLRPEELIFNYDPDFRMQLVPR